MVIALDRTYEDNMETAGIYLLVVNEEEISSLVYSLSWLSSPPWMSQLSVHAWSSWWRI